MHIDASADKSRKERFQVVPDGLAEKLSTFIKSGEAKQLYRRFYSRKDCTMTIPENPLLFVPSHASRMLKELAAKAKVPLETKEGVIVFHGARTTYIDRLIPLTAPKTTQELARHEDPKTTFNGYGRAHNAHLRAAANALEKTMMIPKTSPIHGQSRNEEEDKKDATADGDGDCINPNMVEAAGIEPAS